jgi:hypothetical protein
MSDDNNSTFDSNQDTEKSQDGSMPENKSKDVTQENNGNINQNINSTVSGKKTDIKAKADEEKKGTQRNNTKKTGKAKQGENEEQKIEEVLEFDPEKKYDKRTPLQKIGFNTYLRHLNNVAGNRDTSTKINSELLEAVFYIMKEDLKVKDKEQAVQEALLLLLQLLR